MSFNPPRAQLYALRDPPKPRAIPKLCFLEETRHPNRHPLPSFAQQVQKRLASGEKRGALIEHGTTAAVLRMLGFPAVPLTMAPSILFKIATGKQGERPPLTQRQIERIPELLDDPVAVYIQPGGVSWIVPSSVWDSKNNPIVICLRPNCRDGVRTVNAITTAFGKDYAQEWASKQGDALRHRGEKTNPRLPLPGPIYNQAGAPKNEGSTEMVLGLEDLPKYRETSRAKSLNTVWKPILPRPLLRLLEQMSHHSPRSK